MWRCASFAIVLGTVVLSCFAPRYDDCAITCTDNGPPSACPDGFRCVGSGCLSDDSARTTCAGSGDSMCGWSFVPTNFDPCDPSLPVPQGDYLATGAILTDDLAQYTYGGGVYGLIYAQSFTVMNGATVPVTGSRPLLVVSLSSATIGGKLDATAVAATTCSGDVGAGSTTMAAGGGGGGGGGFASAGGNGGNGIAGSTMLAGGDGEPTHADSLTPLTFGCSGGSGGSGDGASGGTGGSAGGAIEVSARNDLVVSGSVYANGGGGHGGGAAAGAGAGGGGGGASGGGILLEGSMLTVMTGASLCALGGGGGQGGNAMSSNATGNNGDPASGCSAGQGAGGGVAGNYGGTGALGSSPGQAAEPGGSSNMPYAGAGGGGGGVGAICLHHVVSSAGSIYPPSTCPN